MIVATPKAVVTVDEETLAEIKAHIALCKSTSDQLIKTAVQLHVASEQLTRLLHNYNIVQQGLPTPLPAGIVPRPVRSSTASAPPVMLEDI